MLSQMSILVFFFKLIYCSYLAYTINAYISVSANLFSIAVIKDPISLFKLPLHDHPDFSSTLSVFLFFPKFLILTLL